MDSIERMRRINDLTKELKQRGFAESSFEAIQQANQIYGHDDLQDHVKHGVIPDKPLDSSNSVGDDSISYSDKKLLKMQQNIDSLTSKLNEIIGAINDLDSRLNDLKVKQDKIISNLNQVRSEPRVEQRSQVAFEQKREQAEVQRPVSNNDVPVQEPSKPKDEYSVSQRTGSFGSADVAIDKMFYFGNKK